MASDTTYSWNGGTGSASSPSNWTLLPGGTANVPNIPQSDNSIVMTAGDAQFTDMPLPGNDNGTQGGVVFWQGGEIDMINSGSAGGTAGVLPNTLVELTNTVAATGSLASFGTATLAGTIDSDANGALTYSVASGTATNSGLITAANGAALTLNVASGASFVNSGSVLANGGSILISGPAFGSSGYWGMENIGTTASGGTIEVNAAVHSAGNTFDFIDGNNDTLKLDQLSSFQGDLFEFGNGNTVDLGAITVGTIIVSSTGSPDASVTMTLDNASGTPLDTFTMTPFPGGTIDTGTFAVQSNGDAGDFQFTNGNSGDTFMTVANTVVACFMAGTPLATERGAVPVEHLRIGDRLYTIVGGKSEPIIWIGHRTIDCTRHPQPKQVWPVRIAAGTFGRGKPSHDLCLSPDHAIYVEGVLIPVKYLINASSISQVPCTSVNYYHVELPHHDVVLASGLAAESYLRGADRSIFANSGGPVTLHPDLSSRVWEAEGCAPLVVTGPALEAARRRVKVPGRAATQRRRRKAVPTRYEE